VRGAEGGGMCSGLHGGRAYLVGGGPREVGQEAQACFLHTCRTAEGRHSGPHQLQTAHESGLHTVTSPIRSPWRHDYGLTGKQEEGVEWRDVVAAARTEWASVRARLANRPSPIS